MLLMKGEICMKEDLLVINPLTGELITEINEGDKIVRNKQTEFSRTHISNFNKETGYVKLYNGVIPLLNEHLTPREFKFVMMLTDYIGYFDCVLRNGRDVLTLKDLSVELDFSYDVVRKIVPALIQKGIMSEYKVCDARNKKKFTKSYVVNPYLFFRGKYLNKEVSRLFEKSGWQERIEEMDAKYKNN